MAKAVLVVAECGYCILLWDILFYCIVYIILMCCMLKIEPLILGVL